MLWPDLDLDTNPLISVGYSDDKNGLNLALNQIRERRNGLRKNLVLRKGGEKRKEENTYHIKSLLRKN